MVKINTSNPQIFARLLHLYAGYETRKQTEIPFIAQHVVRDKNALILDAACGSGPTSIGLLEAGFTRIVSNEIDNNYVPLANQEAQKRGLHLHWTHDDWRTLGVSNTYDAILLHGNSFTYLFDPQDRIQSLQNFRRALKDGGTLSIDSRNYQRIQNREFSHSGNILYCGVDKVIANLISISPKKVTIGYTDRKTGERACFEGYPFKEGELEHEIRHAGFSDVKVYGDFKSYQAGTDVEFFTFVARK